MKVKVLDAFKDYDAADYFRIAIIAFAYYISGKFGLLLATVNPSATAVWAPTGIAIAAFLVYGRKVLPAIFLGAFFTNLTTAGTIFTSLGIAFGNTLEGYVASYLITHYADGIKTFRRVHGITIFTVIALSATMISATIGVTTLLVAGLTDITVYGSVWGTWWLGDAAGALIVAPLVTLWLTTKYDWKIGRALEAFALLAVLLAISQPVFLSGLHFTYLAVPVLLWAAIRFGPREAATVVFFLTAIATVATLSGVGPFVSDGETLDVSLLLLQMYAATISVMTMITAAVVYERREDASELERSQKRFKALVEKGSDVIALINEKAEILYTGPSTEHVLGWKTGEVTGRNAFELVNPEDREHTMKALGDLLKTPGASVREEYRVMHKDGSWVWMEGTGTNLLNDPNVKAVVINLRDIAERKLIQETVQREKAEDEALIESIGDGIVATDNEGKITVVNKSFEDLLGWTLEEVTGKNTSDILKLQDEKGKMIDEAERPINKALKEKKKITATHYLKRKNETWFPVTIVATPVILDNEIIGAIKVFHDVTREKQIDKAKTEFVSLASHQLKTPLTIINWSIEMMNKKETGNLNDNQRKYLSRVYAASRRMVDLTNALLTISRLELGKITVEKESMNLISLITQALEELKPEIQEKNIEISDDYTLSEELSYTFESDPKLLSMVFQNILSNAVKYTPDGGKIEIKIKVEENDFRVEIKDNGYGIPQNELSKIFTKLFRGSNIQEHDQDGTGLGLYIVKAVLERLGGKVRFESEENKGTTFFITVPKEVKA